MATTEYEQYLRDGGLPALDDGIDFDDEDERFATLDADRRSLVYGYPSAPGVRRSVTLAGRLG